MERVSPAVTLAEKLRAVGGRLGRVRLAAGVDHRHAAGGGSRAQASGWAMYSRTAVRGAVAFSSGSGT